MAPFLWIAIGLSIGLLAPVFAKHGQGLFGDLLFGVLGAFLGGWTVDSLLLATPLSSSALTALLGAIVFVTALRVLHARTLLPTS